MVSKASSYQPIFERKCQEVFEALEVDPKKALKVVSQEIDKRGSKLGLTDQLLLRIVKALVLERNVRASEAREEIFSVLSEI
jgi:hypothetical protein